LYLFVDLRNMPPILTACFHLCKGVGLHHKHFPIPWSRIFRWLRLELPSIPLIFSPNSESRASTRSGSVEIPLATAANRVFSGDKENEGQITRASVLRQEIKSVIPTDEQFRQAFEVATVSKAALARYYLRSLEMASKDESYPWFIPNDDREIINLEHVLPLRPGSEWSHFDEDLARAYVKRLGNQALLLAKDNSNLKSSDFEAKKAIYKESPYVLTREISESSEWGAHQISARQKTLAKLALQVWSL